MSNMIWDRNKLTAQDARELFEYDSTTGGFTWKVAPPNKPSYIGRQAGSINGDGYLEVEVAGTSFKVHRLIILWVTGAWPEGEVDHIDGSRTNNIYDNLRVLHKSDNCKNRGKNANNTSGFKGVSWNKHNQRWCACINADKKRTHLGYFDCPEDAHAAYQAAAKMMFGELARVE